MWGISTPTIGTISGLSCMVSLCARPAAVTAFRFVDFSTLRWTPDFLFVVSSEKKGHALHMSSFFIRHLVYVHCKTWLSIKKNCYVHGLVHQLCAFCHNCIQVRDFFYIRHSKKITYNTYGRVYQMCDAWYRVCSDNNVGACLLTPFIVAGKRKIHCPSLQGHETDLSFARKRFTLVKNFRKSPLNQTAFC